jgi:hypothetical protein
MGVGDSVRCLSVEHAVLEKVNSDFRVVIKDSLPNHQERNHLSVRLSSGLPE